MVRVSVLVAVYNGERFLEECLDSLVGQTLEEIEVVCINDASTDSTPEILSRYASADSRIKILTLSENCGQAVARNEGIPLCTGEFITMVDSDDMLSADALEKAVEVFDSNPETGCVLFDLQYLTENGTEPYKMRSDKMKWSGQEAFFLSLDWSVHGLYTARADLYHQWHFDDTCRLYSDDNTTRMHYLHSTVVGRCNGVYLYRRHAGSMTNADSLLRYDLLEANTSMAGMISSCDYNVRSLFEAERWKNMVGMYGYWLSHRHGYGRDERNTIMLRIRTVYYDVDRSLLPVGLRLKPGYMPLCSFLFFRVEASFYFRLRTFFYMFAKKKKQQQ